VLCEFSFRFSLILRNGEIKNTRKQEIEAKKEEKKNEKKEKMMMRKWMRETI
jgi:hypothetical protein